MTTQTTQLTDDRHTNPHQHQRPTHAEDGTDLTLIRWMLSLTVEERLEALQSQAQLINQIRHESGQA